MSKGTHFSGQPILAQIMNLIPRSEVRHLAARFQSDRYYKKFKTYDHFVAMMYTILSSCTSIREVVTGLLASHNRLHHLGVSYLPRKSTLSDANCRRDYRVFEAIYRSLYARHARSLPDSRRESWVSKLFIVDSTTISLFQEILKNAGRTPMNGKRKGGIKAHTLVKADEDVPQMVRLTSGATHDSTFLKHIDLPRGSIVTFDRAYSDYSIFERWTQNGISFITRLRKNAVSETVDERAVNEKQKQKGVISDTVIILGHQKHDRVTRTKVRRIVYQDEKQGRTFEFVSNNMSMAPSTIAEIYQKRWQIEILFKRIKQNYPLRYFLGDNENAIKIQIWCALIADLLLKIIRKQSERKWAFANMVSMVRLHLMTYISLVSFLNNPEDALLRAQKERKSEAIWSLFPT